MRIKVLPYVTVDVDDRLRRKLRSTAERVRLNVRAYLLSAADDVDTAGDKVRDMCDAAVHRVDDAVGKVTERLGADHVDSDADAHDASGVRLEAG
jgi:hypothetical protein